MTTRQPKVSIIVPVYNVEQYIEACIKSLIAQTLKDIEIIVVDDCGSDNSMDIVQKYAKKDKRIKILKHKKNSGLSASRNSGIDFASAPYLMFCDSDDMYENNMCYEMYNAIEKSGADVAMCGTKIIYEADEQLKKSDDEYYRIKYKATQDITNNLINNCDVSAWNKIYIKEFLKKHDLKYPVGLKYEDAYMFRTYMLCAKKITFVNQKLYNYRRREGSIMNATFKKINSSAIDHLKIAIEIFNYMKKYNKYDANIEYFWQDIFIPYFNFARWHSGKSYQSTIYKIASDFIKKHYVPNTKLDFYTSRTLSMIKDKTLERTKRYFCGIMKITETIDKKVYTFMGIPVYKIKIFQDYQKHYLFGIQYKIKH